MKKGIIILLSVITITANAQTLKDVLYGGKLKTDSGTVIRKGDDLSSKIDTSRKSKVEADKNKLTAATTDSSKKKMNGQADSATIAVAGKMDNNAVLKDNNKIWKEFMDSAISNLKAEVMTSKKVKKGDYYILLDYEIGPDGLVTINNVYPSPENSFLAQEVKERINLTAPRMNPALSSNGKPHKVIKKYNFVLSKM